MGSPYWPPLNCRPYSPDLLSRKLSGSCPARQLEGLGLSGEDLSRRDSMKVEAQYEVLGNDAKRHVRPARDDRNARLLVLRAAQRLPAFIDRPVRDG